MGRGRSKRRTSWAMTSAAMLLSLAVVASGCESGGGGVTPPETTGPEQPVRLTFGAFGPDEEIDALSAMVQAYNDQATTVDVEVTTWPDRAAMMADVEAGAEMPDLFMVERRDLAEVREKELNQPLFDLLDERGVVFGDRYSRDAQEAFSSESELQCMPYSVSPMVIYFNTDLIDFDRIRARGLDAPDEALESWTFEQFQVAAQFASRPRQGTRGVSVDPTLSSLAPFLYSGGGRLFDDDSNPTSLAFSDEDNREALSTTLELLRDPQLTLTDQQLDQASPEEWFKRGRLGMIEGFRDLTPVLRDVEGLNFDVMPMPEIDDNATIGDITGLCIAPGPDAGRTADFLVHAISDESFSTVAEAGYLVPANQMVARSDAFLQPGLMPEHAGTFNASVDGMRLLPLLDSYDELQAAVAPTLRTLLTTPVIEDLQPITEQIDEESRAVLDPDYVPTPSGSATP